MKWLLVLMAAFAMTAAAADISGTWKGSADTPNGKIERTFNFKQDGSKLTGDTSTEMFGKSAISDGKVEGDNVTFTIVVKFQDNEVKLNYTGKVEGDEIKFHVEAPDADVKLDYVAKKVS